MALPSLSLGSVRKSVSNLRLRVTKPVPTERDVGWTAEALWTFWTKVKSLAPYPSNNNDYGTPAAY
jgi:hypothetical protein